MDKTFAKIYICVFICVISMLIFIIIGVEAGKEYYIRNNKVEIIDTTYNKVTLDSIDYVIEKKDSIINIYIKEMEYEKDKVINASDSNIIKQFKELVSE